MEIIITKKVKKKMLKFPSYIRNAVNEIEIILIHFPNVRLDIVKIKGEFNIYRIRKGDYRITFKWEKEKNKILIFDIDIRGRIWYD